MYFKGKADAGDFGPRIAKVNKTGRPDGRRLFGNGSISYGGVKKGSYPGAAGAAQTCEESRPDKMKPPCRSRGATAGRFLRADADAAPADTKARDIHSRFGRLLSCGLRQDFFLNSDGVSSKCRLKQMLKYLGLANPVRTRSRRWSGPTPGAAGPTVSAGRP